MLIMSMILFQISFTRFVHYYFVMTFYALSLGTFVRIPLRRLSLLRTQIDGPYGVLLYREATVPGNQSYVVPPHSYLLFQG